MGAIPRNAIKGYSYQQSIFILFLAIMDAERNISSIVVEATDTKHFDDLYIKGVCCETAKSESYRVQVKNYPGTTLSDIVVTDTCVSIKNNKNDYLKTDNNILVLNTNLIETDSTFMGLPCTRKGEIVIIPITPEYCAEQLDTMFSTDARALQIIHQADNITQNAKFEITIDELPEVIQMSLNLENDTVLLRKVPEEFEHEITLIEGKPGVGKSHFVNELCDAYPDAIVYRFWIGSQDPDANDRIQFGRFINELGIKVYKSAKRVDIDELIEAIKRADKLVIIDGLDHVENYNPTQLDQFVEFIGKLQGARVVVLSRPLKKELKWNKNILLDWTFEEARLYLEIAHNICDYQVQKQIFDFSNGYPIITYFAAEDYILNKKVITGEKPIDNINDYYDTLFINQEKPSVAIGIFAVGNCFFTWKELESFFSEPELFEVIKEFIKLHPYLFKIVANRVSLIHDSFNTYLRCRINTFSKRKEKTLKYIEKSLLDGSIEYVDRMKSFSLDSEFYAKLIKKYSGFSEFKRLLMSTCDYNSVSSLYIQLQKQLEMQKGILDIYQLYSFVLIFEITQRDDLIGSESLVFQILKYMNDHEGIEDNIYSSSYMWHVYLACTQKENMAERYLANLRMSESQYYQLVETINEDCTFFEKKDKIIQYEELIEKLENREDEYPNKILADYLISVWIHGKSENKYYEEFKDYLSGSEKCISKMEKELASYGLDHFWVESGLSSAEYQLHELGFFGEKNKFRNHSLDEILRKGAVEGSFSANTLAASYLKLANYEKRNVDIQNVSYAWTMYYQRKDYSVYTIGKALIIFEKEGLIDEDESVKIISRLMKQSEKGITHLLTNYVNQKGASFLTKLIQKGYHLYDDSICFWELDAPLLECFDKENMAKQLTELLKVHYHSKYIEFKDIANVMQSKYKNMILDGIEYFEYSILSPTKDLWEELDSRSINYLVDKNETKTEYVPLNYGCIHEDDFSYIEKEGIDYIEVAQYTDGQYSCLAYVDVFSLFSKDDIQNNYSEILYEAIFARCPEKTYIGNWYLLIGNIIEFLRKYEVNVDYAKLYDIFIMFLDVSMIWHGSNEIHSDVGLNN